MLPRRPRGSLPPHHIYLYTVLYRYTQYADTAIAKTSATGTAIQTPSTPTNVGNASIAPARNTNRKNDSRADIIPLDRAANNAEAKTLNPMNR